MSSVRISPEERAQIIERLKRGETGASIAESTGYSRATICLIKEKAGLPIAHKKRWSDADIQRIYDLYEQGLSALQISQKMQRNYVSINKYIKRKYGANQTRRYKSRGSFKRGDCSELKRECKTCIYVRVMSGIPNHCNYLAVTGKLRGCVPYGWTPETSGDGCDKWEPQINR